MPGRSRGDAVTVQGAQDTLRQSLCSSAAAATMQQQSRSETTAAEQHIPQRALLHSPATLRAWSITPLLHRHNCGQAQ
eukprot:scaffold61754_cov24-Tisochrysis_lutea.AAC.1